MDEIMPGDRVKVFCSWLFKDDISTPKSVTMREATVTCRYGMLKQTYGADLVLGPYDDLIDVIFDDGKTSCGHFTQGVELVNGRGKES